MIVIYAADVDMAGPSDISYMQQPPPVAAPRGPSPVPRGSSPAMGFPQPPAGQPMMPGFPQPSSGGASSNSYPMAVPRSQPAAAASSHPIPQVNIPQQPTGDTAEY